MSFLKVGVDEVGRGSLAGPVVAAAVIIGETEIKDLNDSKKIKEWDRELIAKNIKEKSVKIAIGESSPKEIDKLNIRQASLLAMKRAILNLKLKNLKIIVDGLDTPDVEYPCKAIVKADSKIPEVMAASIIAKVHRDEIMRKIHLRFPEYRFDKNKGYPTKAHINILKSKGGTKVHRKSFRPLNND